MIQASARRPVDVLTSIQQGRSKLLVDSSSGDNNDDANNNTSTRRALFCNSTNNDAINGNLPSSSSSGNSISEFPSPLPLAPLSPNQSIHSPKVFSPFLPFSALSSSRASAMQLNESDPYILTTPSSLVGTIKKKLRPRQSRPSNKVQNHQYSTTESVFDRFDDSSMSKEEWGSDAPSESSNKKSTKMYQPPPDLPRGNNQDTVNNLDAADASLNDREFGDVGRVHTKLAQEGEELSGLSLRHF